MLTRCKFLGAAAALILMATVGCSNTAAPSAAVAAPPQQALVVSYPNGGGTTVFLSPAQGSDPVMLCTTGTVVCPECKAAAEKYFKTGVLDPKCSLTGATRTVANYSPPNVAHN